MAEGFLALYSIPLRQLMEAREHVAKNILEVLAMCADDLGFCFPGDAYIGMTAGYTRDTVADGLARLEALNYIRLIYTPNPRRRRHDRDIQISPHVIALPESTRPRAIDLWNQYFGSRNEINDHDPTDQESDQESELPTEQPQYQKPDQPPEQPGESKTTFEEGDQPAGALPPQINRRNREELRRRQAEQAQEQNHKQGRGEQANTRSEAKTITAQSAGTSMFRRDEREPRDLRAYVDALPYPEREQIAMELITLAPDLSRENARMLVDVYGYWTAHEVKKLFNAQDEGAIFKPASWIRQMMRRMAPDEDQTHSDENERYSAPY